MDKANIGLPYSTKYYQEHKEQQREKARQWRLKNRDRINKQQQKYRNNHREERRLKQREYNVTHKEHYKQYNKIKYQRDKEKIKIRYKLYAETNSDKISKQKKLYWKKNSVALLAKHKLWYYDNRDKILERKKCYYVDNVTGIKERRNRNRMVVLQHYSRGVPQCNCCGELIYQFLQVDHIDGRKIHGHKREFTGGGLYNWLISRNFPPGFQILCANCNWGKRMNDGICPHQVIIKNTLFPDISK